MTLIALYSPVMGCGKSTVARYLEKDHGFVRVSFAAPMRRMMHALYTYSGLTPQEAYIYLHEDKESSTPLPYGLSTRRMMQTLGTEWGRSCIGPEFWIEVWKRRVSIGASKG